MKMSSIRNFMHCFSPVVLMIVAVQVALASAVSKPECHVRIEDGKCTYHVQIQQPPTECECESWNNATDFVLANCEGKDDRWVMSNTNTSLFTTECFELVTYKLGCRKEYIEVSCVANCSLAKSEALESHSPKANSTSAISVKNHSSKDARRHIFLIIPCVILALLVTGALVRSRKGQRKKGDPFEV